MSTLKEDQSGQQESGPRDRIVGAAPVGANDEASAAVAVRDMFSSIAPRYDLLNHVLSMNVDRLWWNRTARMFDAILARPDARVLDLCCGTGDMTFALRRRMKASSAELIGADFSHPMLVRAAEKTRNRSVRWVEADALKLPFDSGGFDLVTAAFGFRNLANYDHGLAEIYRVLANNGEVGILDFGEPNGLVGAAYRLYFRRVLPAVGTLISGVRGPYAYLPKSVQRFPPPAEMLQRMQTVGFREVSWNPYTFGIAGVYRGAK
ncbi:MAG TPA: bifunctional demethylmenaquinone methyltransferase/2-methoxy-6-polyprenyl-1,4-benzoquinol methylase UbiE [Candidatus Eisenbacteria bacterium]|nr:bifunctional demethylmenaquinone methyltransferase/2-methoxy-6-polyprenyl-1,4-benzoquinol methylase UbiE [Candidatus Eisenbacteria bacterium]